MNDTGFYEEEKRESEQRSPLMGSEESFSELRIRLENCEKRYEDARRENSELHCRNVDLNAEVDQKKEEIRNLWEQIQSMRGEMAQLQDERDSSKQRFEECRAIAERLRDENGKLNDDIKRLEKEKQELYEKIGRLEGQIKTLDENNRDQENYLKSQMRKYEYKIQELTEKMESLQREFDDKSRYLREYQERYGTWEEEKLSMERKVQSLEDKIRMCRNLVADFKRLCNEISAIVEVTEPAPVQHELYEERIPVLDREISPESKPAESGGKKYPWENDKNEDFLAL